MGTQRKRNELSGLEHQSVTSVSAETSLCRALDLLLNHMVEVYFDAEKIHWHLKLNQPERDPPSSCLSRPPLAGCATEKYPIKRF